MTRWLKVTLLAGGLAAAGLAGYAAGGMGAHAQGGPPGMGPGAGPGMGPGFGMMGGEGPGPWARGGRGEAGRHGGMLDRFFINRDNKNLSNDEVRRIAEAGLLWFGERNWRIGEVRDAGSRSAEFSLTTAEGAVIARFTIDRDSGRVRRIA